LRSTVEAARAVRVPPTFPTRRSSDLNGYLSAEINGAPAPGYSSGQAEALMQAIAERELPHGLQFEWTDLTYQQILAGNTAIWVLDRKSTRLNSSHVKISYAVFCLKKK